ncbi:hypothetical protein A6J88_14115 [Neisseria mucosa]|uniref:Uncharacterized protein n=1 Tax=Neisseria mucosa TaxID=488 RepID=A0ABM6T448_NEIMU|nr:hypothetical protein A6J88_14115 [Neisseria mucosa]
MLPHTGLFLLWKVALQMRIRRRLKIHFQTTFFKFGFRICQTIRSDTAASINNGPERFPYAVSARFAVR